MLTFSSFYLWLKFKTVGQRAYCKMEYFCLVNADLSSLNILLDLENIF